MAESTTGSLVCRLTACVLSAGLLGSSVRPAAGSDEATGPEPQRHRPTAAFLDLDGSPLAGLLEGRLLESASAVWLERNAIEEIQREQKLQGLVDAAATRRRASIGKLLNADLLVLLRHLETPKEHVQLVVCETSRGLRLAVHRVVISPKVEEDVRRLSAFVERAIEKRGQEIREICAIPLFVSNDLTYENEHLKAAFAKLAEETVRNRPGLLLVELEEARAIAREVALSGRQLRRPTPLYLLGEFRHEGRGDKQKATLRMRVMRGQHVLASRQATGLSPDGAAKFVQRASGELLGQTIGIRPMPPNSKLEAEQLADRAATFHLLGAWEEAATLAEASLLLDSKQMRMHQIAASSLAALAKPTARWEHKKPPETIAHGLRLYLRALEHYEAYLSSVKRIGSRDTLLYRRVCWAISWSGLLREPTGRSPDIRPMVAKLHKEELEIYRRMIYTRCKMASGDEDRLMSAALRRRPEEEQLDILLEIVQDIQNLPQAERLIRELTLCSHGPSFLDSPAGRRYLQSLAAIDNEQVQRAVGRLRDLVEKDAAKQQPQATVARTRSASPQLLRFQPVEIRRPPAAQSSALRGWIPAGEGVDLVWTWADPALYLMKEPGQLKRIWSGKRFIESVDYDGRFAWVTVWGYPHKPALLVIDPQRERIWEIDEDDGLPIAPQETLPNPRRSQRLWIKALEPGRALLISYFGRMTISNVTFDPDNGAKIRVFFEARVQPDLTDPKRWRNPHVAFQPRYMLGFQKATDDAKPQRRVLIGGRPGYDNDWPLVVDPDTGKVTVVETSVRDGLNPRPLARTPDAVFRSKYNRLYRIGLPSFRPEIILPRDVPEGYCVKHGDKFLIFGLKCWQVDPAAEPQQRVRVLADRVPWPFEDHSVMGMKLAREGNLTAEELKSYRLTLLTRSNHFGLVAVREELEQVSEGHFRFVGEEVFRIVLDEEKGAESQ